GRDPTGAWCRAGRREGGIGAGRGTTPSAPVGSAGRKASGFARDVVADVIRREESGRETTSGKRTVSSDVRSNTQRAEDMSATGEVRTLEESVGKHPAGTRCRHVDGIVVGNERSAVRWYGPLPRGACGRWKTWARREGAH